MLAIFDALSKNRYEKRFLATVHTEEMYPFLPGCRQACDTKTILLLVSGVGDQFILTETFSAMSSKMAFLGTKQCESTSRIYDFV